MPQENEKSLYGRSIVTAVGIDRAGWSCITADGESLDLNTILLSAM
jgi:hypothetical protein